MKQALLFSILICLGSRTFAQTTMPEIVTDRPDQTEAPSLVPTGGIQDAGLTFKITPVVQWDVSLDLVSTISRVSMVPHVIDLITT